MAMDFYFKDIYGSGSYAQTTEQTLPDPTDKEAIVEDQKAADVAHSVAANTGTDSKKIIIAIAVVVGVIIFFGSAGK